MNLLKHREKNVHQNSGFNCVPIEDYCGRIILKRPVESGKLKNNKIGIFLRLDLDVLWGELEGIWSSWVYPWVGGKSNPGQGWMQDVVVGRRLLAPWTPKDIHSASNVLALYTLSLGYLHKTCGERVSFHHLNETLFQLLIKV